ncbi:uncharacterized protein EV154DRAFT_523007 [Mucor mucedo]|uniref:uncharacterized protein n=1 Tax=Mucor mucedo TaxID=29922 RepID=UPI00221F1821|nr:uncharacterized protein EV154DRAFT_523007 [Mucor mucedo]KAI7882306.1 hypothetical protein EV154DRAFT_523007 [Mucor mucedo]
MMNSVRRPVKDLADNKRRWRDKFRQQCNDRMKNDRQAKVNQNRQEQFMQHMIQNEWAEFVRLNEQTMREEGIMDINDLISESIHNDDETQVHLLLEEQELEEAIACYEQSRQCVSCKKSVLTFTSQLASCPTCGFYATESCLAQIDAASFSHAQQCQGPIEVSLEPGTDNTLLVACDSCGLWDMFYM